MIETQSSDASHPHRQRARRMRTAGVVVLVLGVAGAGLAYWLGTRTPDIRDDPSMIGFDKAEQRQMGQLYGGWGTMIEGFQDDLRDPSTQATIILVVAAVISAGCFYLAEPPGADHETDNSGRAV
jgi:hypothetical protein